MKKTGLSGALEKLTAEDISVDKEGRVSVANPEIVRKLSEAVVMAPTTTPTNGSSCSPNASQCSPNSSSCHPK
ncbi:hypothetical protein OG317_36385 [Streptomyces sp. NBC_01167]|uniref:hypothetical protein n=1 Tax=Streptomyces sp. NBC_01167 TaxID=2903756 RepID=UPI00386582F8|nr:hypothetical protein OG317_36385 [Streptomyces sp. NBC_01167]